MPAGRRRRVVNSLDELKRQHRLKKSAAARDVQSYTGMGSTFAFAAAVWIYFAFHQFGELLMLHTGGWGGLGFFAVTVLEGINAWAIWKQLKRERKFIENKDVFSEDRINKAMWIWRLEVLLRLGPSLLICLATFATGVSLSVVGIAVLSQPALAAAAAVAALNPLTFTLVMALMMVNAIKNFFVLDNAGRGPEGTKVAQRFAILSSTIFTVGAFGLIPTYLASVGVVASSIAVVIGVVCFPLLATLVTITLAYMIYLKVSEWRSKRQLTATSGPEATALRSVAATGQDDTALLAGSLPSPLVEKVRAEKREREQLNDLYFSSTTHFKRD